MTQAKHTPGPWTTDEGTHDAPYQNISVWSADTREICVIWQDDSPDREFNAQQQANARLIAAAPTLLFALQYALPFIPKDAISAESYENGGPSVADVVAKAIAKATGGAA